MNVPVLESERLRLRGHKVSDFVASFGMWSDPRVTRFIGGKPSTEQQSWARMMSYVGHWAFMGFGYWLIEEKSTGRFVGELGFADFKREIEPSLKGIAEFGWALTPDMQGKGYATEALQRALEWGRDHLPTRSVKCIIDHTNAPSLRLAEKVGFKEAGEALYMGEKIRLFSLHLS